MKRVQIVIEMDEHFVRLLNAQLTLKKIGPNSDKQLSPMEVLAVVALAEARGAYPEEIHAMTPIEWRPHIEAITKSRLVKE
jgi:hypothetical protein